MNVCRIITAVMHRQQRKHPLRAQRLTAHIHPPPPPPLPPADLTRTNNTCAVQVYSTAAARLVEWACAGGNALLLVAGTPGSGRSHTLFGGGASNPNAPGEAEQGLLPRALADLERRWRGGESGSPLPPCSSPQRSLAASTFVVRLCVAEVSCGIVETTTDLLRDAVVDAKQVSSSPTRWSFSAKGMLAVIASPPRFADGSGGGGGRRRKSAGRGSHGAAAGLLTSQVLVGVTEVTAGGVAEAVAFVRQVGAKSPVKTAMRRRFRRPLATCHRLSPCSVYHAWDHAEECSVVCRALSDGGGGVALCSCRGEDGAFSSRRPLVPWPVGSVLLFIAAQHPTLASQYHEQGEEHFLSENRYV